MKSKFSILAVILISVIICCVSCNRSAANETLATDENTGSKKQTDSLILQQSEATDPIQPIPTEDTEPEPTETAEPIQPIPTENTEPESTEPLSPVEAAIKEVSDELEQKGWQNIEVFEGEPPYNGTSRWGYLIIEPYDLDDDSILYSIVGQSDKMSAIVRVVWNSKTSEAQRVEHFYTATSGRELKGIYLESFLNTSSKPDEILSADDEEMYLYLCTGY